MSEVNIFKGPATYKLSESQTRRAMEIINDFLLWHPDTTGESCPLSVNSVWFKRVCAMAERISLLESEKASK